MNSITQTSDNPNYILTKKSKKHEISDRDCYFSLLNDSRDQSSIQKTVHLSESYIYKAIDSIKQNKCDLPKSSDHLEVWFEEHIRSTGDKYTAYLRDRKNGAPRLYFPKKSHALVFLQRIAPVKKVDGAWLYGILKHWSNSHLHPLIYTYLDEIGNGISEHNHVSIFEKLLKEQGINHDVLLSEDYYKQGCIQLALGHASSEFLPEVIGFNLGYEMLPLHLLITTYELRELGIDPAYFRLHITIDNPECGHAKQAMTTILSLLPQDQNAKNFFYERLKNGYLLNDWGLGSQQIIDEIDLKSVVMEIFSQKAKYGQYAHSNYCSHAGKTVNEWLSESTEIPLFIDSLKQKGWIKFNENPELSRFWHLIQGDKALMFGVFTDAEKQIIYDWIAEEWTPDCSAQINTANHTKPLSLFSSLNLSLANANLKSHPAEGSESNHFLPCWIRQMFEGKSRSQTFDLLIPYLSPRLHHSTFGLIACKKYLALLSNNTLMDN